MDRIQRGEGRIRRLGEGGVEEHAGQRAEEDGGGMPRSGCGLGVEEPRRGPGASTSAMRERWAWPCSTVVSRLRVSLLMIPDHLLPGVGYMLLSQFAWVVSFLLKIRPSRVDADGHWRHSVGTDDLDKNIFVCTPSGSVYIHLNFHIQFPSVRRQQGDNALLFSQKIS